MTLPAFVDAEAVVRAWLNSRTQLVGAGKPLRHGVHLTRLRSPQAGAYALLERLGGYDDRGDSPIDYARVSFQVYASQKEAAARAATALANELRTGLDGTPQRVDLRTAEQVTQGFPPATRTIIGCASITGPSNYPDGEEPRYVVDALVLITPGP